MVFCCVRNPSLHPEASVLVRSALTLVEVANNVPKMAWEPPEGISLEDSFYHVMEKITHRDWMKFARSALRLDTNEIDEIKSDYRGNAKEQKFRMLKAWSTKIGSVVSVKYLYDVLNHYLFPGKCPSPMPPKKSTTAPNPQVKTQAGDAATLTFTPASDLETDLEQYCSQVAAINVTPCSPEFFAKNCRLGSNYECAFRKGNVLIINNSFIQCDRSYRKGSEIDVKNMEELWKKLGCVVEIHADLTTAEMKLILGNFANSCDGCDFCVVLVMSHGNCDGGSDLILGNNGGKLFIKDILDLYNNVSSPHLQGKPKLFFFQCCRGVSKDSGVDVAGGAQTLSEIQHVPTPNLQDSTLRFPQAQRESSRTVTDAGPSRPSKLPTVSDMLISYATQFGHQAYRNTDHGSWFINAIANVFMRHAKDEHVLDMMLKVNEAVSAKSAGHDGAKAMPHIEVTLKRKIYLYPQITD